jgi:ribonuclease-3
VSEIDLTLLMLRLNYQFQDRSLIYRALSHRSIGSQHNERLEFLGDAVLSLIISNELYERHPRAQEGSLSRMRASLVNGEILAEFAQNLEIGPYLSLGPGEKKSGGHQRRSILADSLEAIIGAIYLDGGMEPCRYCVLGWYGERFDDLATLRPKQDAKSQLQEWAQAHKFQLPIYELSATGKAHEQTFLAVCRVDGLHYYAEGKSTSRRKAEQLAARHFLDLVL